MNAGRAFELSDLTVLLGLDLAEPDDQCDIEAIEVILERRRTAQGPVPADRQGSQHRTTLYLVPNASS
jgi:hypothetical protein